MFVFHKPCHTLPAELSCTIIGKALVSVGPAFLACVAQLRLEARKAQWVEWPCVTIVGPGFIVFARRACCRNAASEHSLHQPVTLCVFWCVKTQACVNTRARGPARIVTTCKSSS